MNSSEEVFKLAGSSVVSSEEVFKNQHVPQNVLPQTITFEEMFRAQLIAQVISLDFFQNHYVP